jgi:uroporphyrinogen-III synthase
VDHLAGWTIAVTADHRAVEQAALLQRRGAEVVLAPLVATAPVPEPEAREATAALVSGPVDVFVATSAGGLRSWLAMTWTWGLGEVVQAALRDASIVARGAATIGVLVGEDLQPPWRAPSATLSEVLDELRALGVAGRRIGVQEHGGDVSWFVDALRAEGAEVVAIPVYRVAASVSPQVADRLSGLVARGELDALTCTSRAAVDGLVEGLRAGGVSVGCVGPGTAVAAREAGLDPVITAEPHRLGVMVRTLGEHLAERGQTLDVAGVELRHQGGRIAVDGHEVRLTPRERRLLEVLLTTGGVLSKERLAATAWDAPVDTHTVEVAVNRLRKKLGAAALALETTNRRGYRIARSG